MPSRLLLLLTALAACTAAVAQEPPPAWSWGHRLEIRGDYRWSADERLARPFPPGAVARTPDPGHHVELNAVELQLDLGYGEWLAARVKIHAHALHRRNPTSSDRQVDADELFVRIGPKPEFLGRPRGTTFFLQAGKFPKEERQPVRMLESYGLAATAFNRFEDTQVLVGGTVGRSVYWRLQAANGNPLFMRDPNALAGDNGAPGLRESPPRHEFFSGFPILYNAETEDLFLNTSNLQIGEALGYRWQRADESAGIDLIVFHYRRDLKDRADLTGTFYGGDLDILDSVHPARPDLTLPIIGRTKEEYGARLYAEWGNGTAIAQFTKQNVAGLQREGWELETGYRIPLSLGPLRSIQPAARASGITNRFAGPAAHPAPSLWWQWTKIDGGVRVALTRGFDVTLEYSKHNVGSRIKLNRREALATIRWRG